jgi:hypothetical protein
VLYVCLPVHNEAATVGVLLWRLRTVLQELGRDYEVVVYDDASTDATAEVLAPYAAVLPLTVLGGPGPMPAGRSAAAAVLLRHVAAHARYPRRDACLLLQGDFSEPPDDLTAYFAAFDGGADVVTARRAMSDGLPVAERRLRRLAPWVLRPLVRVEGVDDLLAGPRLFRASVLRDLVRARGGAPLLAWDGWAGRAELMIATAALARRLTVVDATERPPVRTRASRLDWALELRAIARYAWQRRGTRVRPLAPAPARAEAATPVAAPPRATLAESQGDPDPRAERPERPRRAERTPKPRPAPDAPMAASSAPPARTMPVPPARGSLTPDADESVERPRTLSRGRRARRDSGQDGVQSTSEEYASVSQQDHGTPEPSSTGGSLTSPAPAELDLDADEPGTRARRRKRRPRSRSGSDETSASVTAAGDGGPDVGAESSAAEALAPADEAHARPRRHDAPEADPGQEADDALAGEGSDEGTAPGRARKRRRRRGGRTRSADGGSGVSPTDTGAAVPSTADPLSPGSGDGRPAPAPPSISTADRQPPPE